MKKYALIAGSLVLVAGLMWFFLAESSSETVRQDGSTSVTSQDEGSQTPVIRLLATGDMIPHDTVNLRSENEASQPYVAFFNPLRDVFNTADLMFCNQEAPSAGESFGISGYPTFNAPISFAQGLSAIGCNIINLANNHTADKGTAGIDATLDAWRPLSPYAIGGANSSEAEQKEPAFFDYQGKTFAFVAFAEFSNNTAIPGYAVNIFSDSLVNSVMQKASAADFVIVSAHWGVEGQTAVSAFQREWAEKLTAAGANLIIGTGPHVVQTVEEITAGGNTALTYFSLGNALSSQLQVQELFGGIAVIDLALGDEISVSEAGFLPVYMHYEWSAGDAAAQNLLARDNLSLMPLDAANDELIRRQQLSTSVAEQRQRLRQLVTKNLPITFYESADF